jgi:subtilisin family serine protease
VLSKSKKVTAVLSALALGASLMAFMGTSAVADGGKVSIEATGFSKQNRYIVSGTAATKNFLLAKFAGNSRNFFRNHTVVFAKKGEIVSALRNSKLNLGQVKVYPDQFIKTPKVDAIPLQDSGGSLFNGDLPSIVGPADFTNDVFWEFQWSLWPDYELDGPGTNFHGVNLLDALDITDDLGVDPGEGANVAIIDTGYTVHPELDIADSADFVSIDAGNDGDDWDNDGADPGDWCGDDPSSWHGTHVHGTIAASTNDGNLVGIAPYANVVHARALGTCGGYRSDIVAAMLWSAGESFVSDGISNNAYPADIINMSLGGGGTCDPMYDEALSYIRSYYDALVVVSAGNGYDPAAAASPAGCTAAFTVASSGSSGERAYYSNYGINVDITAPGGDWCDTKFSQWGFDDFANCLDSFNYWGNYMRVDYNMVVSTLNDGLTTPEDPTYAFYQGTSMAAPHVSGVAALVLSVNDALNVDQLEEVLTRSSASFGDIEYSGYALDEIRGENDYSCLLHEYMCGSGIVNAYNALDLALETEGTDGSRVTRVNITPSGDLTKGSAKIDFFLPADLMLRDDLSYVDVTIKLRGATNTTKCRANPMVVNDWNQSMSCTFTRLTHGKVYDVVITPTYGRTKGESVTRSFTTVRLPKSAKFTSITVSPWEDLDYGMYDGIATVRWSAETVPWLTNRHPDDAYYQVEAYSDLAGESWNLCLTYSTSCQIPYLIPGDRVKFKITTITTRGQVVSNWTKWYLVPGTIPMG